MSVPSKGLAAALRRDQHTAKSLEALQVEFLKAQGEYVDSRFRQYRVVASLAASKGDDGAALSGARVRELVSSPFEINAETFKSVKKRWSNARISQVRGSAMVARAFGVVLADASTEELAQTWGDFDAIRRAGTKWVRDLTGESTGDLADLLPTAIKMAQEQETANAKAGDRDARDALEVLAAHARSFRSTRANDSRADRAEAKRTDSPSDESNASTPAGDSGSDPGKSTGSIEPVAHDADSFVRELERLAGIAGVVTGWSSESYDRAQDLIAVLSSALESTTTDQLAKN